MRDPMGRVEMFEAGMEAFNNGDAEAFLVVCDPDCEWCPFLMPSATGEPYRGREGVREWLRTVAEEFEHLSTKADEIIDAPDRLIALGEIRYRARGSEVEASAPIAWVFDFRDGLIWRGRVYTRHKEALEEAELTGEGMRPTR
jgi:ketosteroid isomerase-like protein